MVQLLIITLLICQEVLPYIETLQQRDGGVSNRISSQPISFHFAVSELECARAYVFLN